MQFIQRLDAQIAGQNFLFGGTPSLADMSILPFIRQFAFIDKPRFDDEAGGNVSQWLERFLTSALFASTMEKLPVWQSGDATRYFP